MAPTSKPTRKRRIARFVLLAVLFCTLGLFLLGCWLHEARPAGKKGNDAEQVAQSMAKATGIDGWKATGAIAFTFAGKHKHVWDRVRDRAAVEWDDCRALFSTQNREGRVWCDQQEVTEQGARKAHLEKAYAYWVNDTFWLAAPFKAFDAGTSRAIVRDEGRDQLLVTYGSGGLTPGDAYLWTMGKTGRPEAWEMWVSIIPIGGVRASWEDWVRLKTGAWISTRHALGPMTLRLEDVVGAASLDVLTGYSDTFAPLDNQ